MLRAPPPVQALPKFTGNVSECETSEPAGDAGDCDDAKEIPETLHHAAGFDLIGKKSPRKRRSPDEPDKKSEVREEILDRRSAEMIVLGLQKIPPTVSATLNLESAPRYGHTWPNGAPVTSIAGASSRGFCKSSSSARLFACASRIVRG